MFLILVQLKSDHQRDMFVQQWMWHRLTLRQVWCQRPAVTPGPDAFGSSHRNPHQKYVFFFFFFCYLFIRVRSCRANPTQIIIKRKRGLSGRVIGLLFGFTCLTRLTKLSCSGWPYTHWRVALRVSVIIALNGLLRCIWRRRFSALKLRFRLSVIASLGSWGFLGLSRKAWMASTKVALPEAKHTHLGSLEFKAEACQTPTFSMAMKKIRCFLFW